MKQETNKVKDKTMDSEFNDLQNHYIVSERHGTTIRYNHVHFLDDYENHPWWAIKETDRWGNLLNLAEIR